MVEIVSIARSDASIGDVAALKLGMLSSPQPALVETLRCCRA